VGPGPTDTDALNATLTDDVKKVCIPRTPLGRLGTLSDIADVVAFLASPDARWVTGHTLFATGGFMP
jgi:3-oxoacyl-[acyl-carrier protein] reductase